MDNTDLGTKIKAFRKDKNLSTIEFSELYGFKAENVYKWQRGTRPGDPKEYHRLLEILEIIPDYKLEEAKNFRKSLAKAKIDASPALIPFMPVKAQAGYLRSYDHVQFLDTLDKYSLPPGVDPYGAEWCYFEVEGDSMEPSFTSGDIILASLVPQMDWENIRNYYVYILVTESELLIKRIFIKSPTQWVLISDNEEQYPQRLFHVEELKQLWVYRRTFHTHAKPPKRFEIKI